MTDFLLSFVIYFVAIAVIAWMYSRKVSRLEEQVEAQDRIVTALALALSLHLDGRSVSMHMIPIRTDEEE